MTGVSHDLSHDVTNTSILECQFLCCMPATRLFFLQCWYLNSEILLNRFDEKGRFPFNTVSKPEDSSKTLEPPTFCLSVIKIHLFLDLLCWDSTSCIFGNFRVNQTRSSLQLLSATHSLIRDRIQLLRSLIFVLQWNKTIFLSLVMLGWKQNVFFILFVVYFFCIITKQKYGSSVKLGSSGLSYHHLWEITFFSNKTLYEWMNQSIT